MTKRARKQKKTRIARRLMLAVPLALVAAGLYGLVLGWQVTREFDVRGWDLPARVYAAPLELFPGKTMSAQSLQAELARLSYRKDPNLGAPGSYSAGNRSVTLLTRPHASPMGGIKPSERFSVEFADGAIARLRDAAGAAVSFAELDPMLIGSIFPAHGEDRIVLAPGEVPDLVIAGLITVEDRRFGEHFGIDLRGIARAALVNIRSGELQQGASTLTQQLVRSYFLNSERTWWRKLREAFMAVALEMRKSKSEIAHAYVNEVYLGQDGARAIHGFGLASQFYFAKPLAELDVHEIALLIAVVRGPSYYDPRRNPERALARRNLVIEQMAAAGLVAAERAQTAAQRELGLVRDGEAGYYASFLDLVRRQLKSDYAAEDLESKGLLVFSTLDPRAQALAASAVATELDALQAGRPPLEAAVIVTTPQNSEVKALVGGRNPGFNRALDARRQIGSLVKPAVYLAALESGSTTFASLVEDVPIEVPLEDGTQWAPTNYEGAGNGTVTAARALAESLNLATVHVGLQTGVAAVADVISRLADIAPPPAYPSLLLGAAELTPLEVAKLYNTLANGGFREPLRAVRSVVDASGETLQHYRIEIEQAADPAAVYALNKALVQVMSRGTGRSAQRELAAGLTTAGKTGTSDDLRDSWFAGFSADHLVVTWIGNDANEPVQLTGATGAARIWSRVLGALDTRAYAAQAPGGIEDVWVDYETGLATEASCPAAVPLAMARSAQPAEAARCGSTRTRFGSRLRRMLGGGGK